MAHRGQYVGFIGTTCRLVAASSLDQAREKVAEHALAQARQKGLLFDPAEIQVRRAKPRDLLVFNDAGSTMAAARDVP